MRAVVLGLVLPAHPATAQPDCRLASLPAYAHNDYENAQPLHDALALGFRGVEVDVFLLDGTLRVGHDRRQAARAPSLEDAYLAPLRTQIAACTRLTNDDSPFLLAIEIKESSQPTYDTLVRLLATYSELFADGGSASPHRAAPVEVVLVGWHPPLATLTRLSTSASTPRIQLRLSSDHTRLGTLDARIRLLSLDYGKTMGRWWRTDAAQRRWLDMLRAARVAAPDRLIRVHNVPVDARVYDALRKAGVDLIGTKQLARTQQLLGRASDP